MEAGEFLKGPKQKINGFPFPEVILADSGFRQTEYVMTPYDMTGIVYALDERQVNYNRRLSRARVRVENAIGYLKNRFTILKR